MLAHQELLGSNSLGTVSMHLPNGSHWDVAHCRLLVTFSLPLSSPYNLVSSSNRIERTGMILFFVPVGNVTQWSHEVRLNGLDEQGYLIVKLKCWMSSVSLDVAVIHANLDPGPWWSFDKQPDVYTEVFVDGEKRGMTRALHNNQNPQWNILFKTNASLGSKVRVGGQDMTA